MSSFTDNRADSDQSLNSDFLIQATTQKFFNQNNFVTIKKNFLNAILQYNQQADQEAGQIFVEISYNITSKVFFKYHPPKRLGRQKIMQRINEANTHAKTSHSKFIFDSTTNSLLCLTILKRDEINQNCLIHIQHQLSSAFSHFQKIIHLIKSQTHNSSAKKPDQNRSPVLNKIKATIEKLKWFMIKKIIDRKHSSYLYPSNSLEKCPVNFQFMKLSDDGEFSYCEMEISKIFEQLSKEQEKKKKQRKNETTILSGIKFNKKQEVVDEVIPESKLSQLKLLKAAYQIQKVSINKKVVEHFGGQLGEQKQGILICKFPKQYGKRSFNVQMSILKHIRMESSPYISSFYVQQLIQPADQPKCHYSPFYEGDIGSDSLGIKKKFRLVDSLANGLQFLEGIKIIHRDLKPKNILYTSDPSLCCKIIDFGSAHPLQKYAQTKLQLNQPLSTTLKYNLFQQDTPLAVQALYTPTQFEQHQNYDMYAFGVILEEFFLNQSSKLTFGDYVWQNLMWIKDHLKSFDPNERLTPAHSSILVKLLLKYFVSSIKISP